MHKPNRLDAERSGIKRLAVRRLGKVVDHLQFGVARLRKLLHIGAAAGQRRLDQSPNPRDDCQGLKTAHARRHDVRSFGVFCRRHFSRLQLPNCWPLL